MHLIHWHLSTLGQLKHLISADRPCLKQLVNIYVETIAKHCIIRFPKWLDLIVQRIIQIKKYCDHSSSFLVFSISLLLRVFLNSIP